MKKLILPLLLLLGITMLVAVESAPSDVVGYFKLNIADGGWQALSLPFAYPSLSVGATIGDQFLENDVILDINTASSSTYYAGFGWDGDLTDLAYGGAYYINRYLGNGANQYFLLGKVDPQVCSVTLSGNGGWTALGLNEAAPVGLSDALFGANETENDVMLDINTASSATYYAGFGWDGDLTEINPTSAYYYNVAVGAPGFTWTYTPTRGSATPHIVPSRNTK